MMRRVRRSGWRWDRRLGGLRNAKLGLLVQPHQMVKFDLENEHDLQIALLGIETGATAKWHGLPSDDPIPSAGAD